MQELRNSSAYCSAFIILLIQIPLLLPKERSVYHACYSSASILQHTLQISSSLMIAHISCLASIFPLAIELCFDFSSQALLYGELLNSPVVKPRERFFIFLVFAMFNTAFLYCQTFEIVSAFYVSAYYSRSNILMSIIYFSVYSELRSKYDAQLNWIFFSSIKMWEVSNLLTAYSVYFNNRSILIASNIIQSSAMVFLIYFLQHWFVVIERRQKDRRLKNRPIKMEEYIALAYVSALLISGLLVAAWNTLTGDHLWQTRAEISLLFYMILHYVDTILIAFVPKTSAANMMMYLPPKK